MELETLTASLEEAASPRLPGPALSLLLLLPLLLLALPCRADELVDSLLVEALPSVQGASRFAQPTLDAPASVSIVTHEEIRSFGYRTLGDLLRSVRGFQLSQDGIYQFAGLRGFALPSDYNDRFLVLVDGHRINDGVYGGVLLGEGGLVDLSLVERVEIIRGPGSALYGTSALFAVVNVITRQGRELQGGGLEGELGSEGRRRRALSYGRRDSGRSEFLVHGSSVDGTGRDMYFPEYDLGGSDEGWARGMDGESADRLYGKVSVGDITAWGARVRRRKVIPTAAWETVFGDSQTVARDELRSFDLRYEPIGGARTSTSFRLFYDLYEYHGRYAYDHGPPDGIVMNEDRSRGETMGSEWILRHQPSARHRLTMGLDFRRAIHLDQLNHDEGGAVYVDHHRSESTTGLFLQDQWRMNRRDIFDLGLRRESVTGGRSFTAPRLALIHRPGPSRAWKLLYGRAFRSANVYERFYVDPVFQKENPELRPERMDSWELVFEEEIGARRRFTASAFAFELRDFISQVEDPVDGMMVFRNQGRYRGRGLEVEHQWAWGAGSSLALAYALSGVRVSETVEVAQPASQHDLKIHWRRKLAKHGLGLGVEGLWRSARRAPSGERLGSDWVCNLNVFHPSPRPRGLEWSFRVTNLFNAAMVDVVGPEHSPVETLPLAGRGLQIRARLRF